MFEGCINLWNIYVAADSTRNQFHDFGSTLITRVNSLYATGNYTHPLCVIGSTCHRRKKNPLHAIQWHTRDELYFSMAFKEFTLIINSKHLVITEALSYVLCPTPMAKTGRPCQWDKQRLTETMIERIGVAGSLYS